MASITGGIFCLTLRCRRALEGTEGPPGGLAGDLSRLSRLGIYLPTIYPLSIYCLCRRHVDRASQRHIPPPPSPQPGRPCRWPPTHLTEMTVATSCVVAQLVEGGTAPPLHSAKAVGATAGVTPCPGLRGVGVQGLPYRPQRRYTHGSNLAGLRTSGQKGATAQWPRHRHRRL